MELKTTTDQSDRLVNSVVRMKEVKGNNSTELPANKEVQARAEPKKKPQVFKCQVQWRNLELNECKLSQ